MAITICFIADSDNTDDENGESQVSMETKEKSRVTQAKEARSQLSGKNVSSHFDGIMVSMNIISNVIQDICPGVGKTTVTHIPTPCDGPIVEREMMALGSRAPGLQDPLHSVRQANVGCVESPPVRHLGVEALVRASQISVYYPAVGSEESMSLASDYYGSVFSLYRQRTFSIYSVQE